MILVGWKREVPLLTFTITRWNNAGIPENKVENFHLCVAQESAKVQKYKNSCEELCSEVLFRPTSGRIENADFPGAGLMRRISSCKIR